MGLELWVGLRVGLEVVMRVVVVGVGGLGSTTES